MNNYTITYSFNGGPEMTAEKTASTERKAKRMLMDQIGNSRLLKILKTEQVG